MGKSLAFDIDGVLYPWTQYCYEYCKEIGYNTTRSIEDFFENVFDQKMNKILKKNILEDPILYYKALISSEYKDLLWKFNKAGWDIYYITIRPEPVWFTTRMWLKNSKVPQYDNVYFPEKKSTIIRQYNIDYLVEDRQHIVEDCKSFCEIFLVNSYWNRLYIEPDNCTRVNSILDLERILL